MQSTFSRSVVAAALVGAGVAAAFAGTALRPRPTVAAPEPAAPGETLRDTGFYSEPLLPFTPQYPLWSDGATKRRWIYLPPGTSIDASQPDAWQFPVGTRLWKEFAFHGTRTETRYMVRTRDGWQYATYVWSDGGTTATRAPKAGTPSVELAPGVRHRIPSEADCRACHATGPTPVLGFGALQLSPDRDPHAVHRETPMAGSIDLTSLVARGMLRGLSPALLLAPPRIPGRSIERAALGYLHANCGGCHRSDGPLASVGMELAHSIRAPGAVHRTTIGQPAHFRAPRVRVVAGDPAHSLVLARMSARTPLEQMPPLGTQLVDTEATRLVASWIDQLSVNRN